jgi:hypothetical protein
MSVRAELVEALPTRCLQMTNKQIHFTGWHVGVAAEAIAASLFARCGLDVSVQYGANQPEYDLLVVRGDDVMKISVKGSKDGGWGLIQSYLPKRTPADMHGAPDYHAAIERWLAKHGEKTIFCFVQFQGVTINGMPRVYLASPSEVAARLQYTAKGRGDTVLYERKVWTDRAVGAGTVDEIPSAWNFSEERVDFFLRAVSKMPTGQIS